jgi:hypothetical protein
MKSDQRAGMMIAGAKVAGDGGCRMAVFAGAMVVVE